MTDIRPLSRDTLLPLLDLEVRPDQSDFVAPNAVTVAESLFEPGSEIHGVWDGKTPVGLIAIVDMGHPEAVLEAWDDPDGIDLWRLMIAAGHQGRGHGTAALDFVIALARDRGRGHVSLSSVEAAGCAIPFYDSYGFRRTGRTVAGDEAQFTYRLRGRRNRRSSQRP